MIINKIEKRIVCKGEYMMSNELEKCLNIITDISEDIKSIANTEINECISLLNKGFESDNSERILYIMENIKDNSISISNELKNVKLN